MKTVVLVDEALDPGDSPAFFSLRLPGRRASFVKAMGGGLAFGAIVGLLVGLVVQVTSVRLTDSYLHWLLGVPACALLGTGFAIVRWGRTPIESAPPPDPRSVLTADGVIVLGLAIVCLALVPGIYAAAFTSQFGAHFLYGLGLGLTIWLAITLTHTWPQYFITATWLAAWGHIPWRLATFLEDARRLQVLRQRGPAYQFRHSTLRDHLAEG